MVSCRRNEQQRSLSLDIVGPEERGRRMSRVRSKGTLPELVVRRLAHALGFRFRLHGRLPGHPDLVFTSRKKVVFVHGCFWHRHPRCKKASTPSTNVAYWIPKFRANVLRDKRKTRELLELGWSVIVVWECETKEIGTLRKRLRRELTRD